MTDAEGGLISAISYLPFGSTRSGDVQTDRKFTGQRLDQTGLYFYNARYYDAVIGRFVSPDSIISTPWNPQSFNRYTYVLNNPLKYIDPTGRIVDIQGIGDVNDISIDDWANLILMPAESVKKIMTLIQAYQTVRDNAPTETQILEDAKETYTIKWGNTGNFPDSKFDVDSGTIILNTNLQYADSFHISNQIQGNVYDAANNFVSFAEILQKPIELLYLLPDNPASNFVCFVGGIVITSISGSIFVMSILAGDAPMAFLAGDMTYLGWNLAVYGFNRLTNDEYNLWAPSK